MVNELKIFKEQGKKLHFFVNGNPVFMDTYTKAAKKGLGSVVEGTMINKGGYSFATFVNIPTIVPKENTKLSFYANKGVPIKIEKGYYGDNVILKEHYRNTVFLRAYKEDGTVGLYEEEILKTKKYTGINKYYTELNDLVEEWVDITDEILPFVYTNVVTKEYALDIKHPEVLKAVSKLKALEVYKLEKGPIIINGVFESLVVWNEEETVCMTWLGKKLDVLVDFKNITDLYV